MTLISFSPFRAAPSFESTRLSEGRSFHIRNVDASALPPVIYLLLLSGRRVVEEEPFVRASSPALSPARAFPHAGAILSAAGPPGSSTCGLADRCNPTTLTVAYGGAWCRPSVTVQTAAWQTAQAPPPPERCSGRPCCRLGPLSTAHPLLRSFGPTSAADIGPAAAQPLRAGRCGPLRGATRLPTLPPIPEGHTAAPLLPVPTALAPAGLGAAWHDHHLGPTLPLPDQLPAPTRVGVARGWRRCRCRPCSSLSPSQPTPPSLLFPTSLPGPLIPPPFPVPRVAQARVWPSRGGVSSHPSEPTPWAAVSAPASYRTWAPRQLLLRPLLPAAEVPPLQLASALWIVTRREREGVTSPRGPLGVGLDGVRRPPLLSWSAHLSPRGTPPSPPSPPSHLIPTIPPIIPHPLHPASHLWRLILALPGAHLLRRVP